MTNSIDGFMGFLQNNYNDVYSWRRALVRRNEIFQNIDRENCVHIMDEDWDNLFVLDACRTDLFEETVSTTRFDIYNQRTSLGSLTPEWTEHNFQGRQFYDTVYVTGNPWVSKIARDSFYDLIEVWDGSFDQSLWTVRADSMSEAAVEHYQEDKRLIVHFMQPHPPFICEVDETPERALEIELPHWRPDRIMKNNNDGVYNIWHALGRGKIDHDSVWNAYKKSLEYVFEYAMELAKAIPGKTVITSDHGILMGERLRPIPIRAYGHPYNVRHRCLTKVPWGVIDDKRRDISVSEQQKDRDGIDEEAVKKRLRKLGYAE